MGVGAQLSTTEVRQATRYPVSCRPPGEHRTLGVIPLQIVNLSRSGFLVLERMGVTRGDRVMMALPEAGHIEASCLWTRHQQAGFQFERPIRRDDFDLMLDAMNFRGMKRRRSLKEGRSALWADVVVSPFERV